jgi:hypothetical protein
LLWKVNPNGRVQVLCAQEKVFSAIRFGNTWAIPKDAVQPRDGRYKDNIKLEE